MSGNAAGMLSRHGSTPFPADKGRAAGAPAVRRRTRHWRRWVTAAVFLLPAFVALLMLRVVPTVEAVTLALGDGERVGTWENFEAIFTDPLFTGSLRTTLLFGVIINPLQIALALFLAVVLTQRIPLVGLWRTLILLPVAVPQVVSAIVWLVLLRPDGPLNSFLERFGMPSVPWLINPRYALWSIIIVCSWVGVGYWMTFLVAGIQEIPRSLYEAAEIDGAGTLRRFRHITLPGVRRQLLFVLVADTVANFLVFAPVRILTQGGPARSTDLVMHNIFERAYTLGDLQSASAATIVLVLILLVVVSIQFRLLPGKE